MSGPLSRLVQRPGRALLAVALLAVLVAGALTVLVSRGGQPSGSSSAGPSAGSSSANQGPTAVTATTVGRAFLADYVQDGRVVRTDQGGDTVSEGQAYGMLVAVGLHDQAAFGSVWNWTRQHLQRPDLLLSWRWGNGQVVDPASASDADLDAARALVLAGRTFGNQGWTADGVALGRAILDRETAQTGAGRVLAAGTWAMTEPYGYNPSYVSPAAVSLLRTATGDRRWDELDAGSRAVTAALLAKAPLPPDWAQVHADGQVDAMPGPQGQGQSVRFGYDAARTPIRFAESCQPAEQQIAAHMTAPMGRAGDAAELDLGGSPLGTTSSVVAVVAQAAAKAASGDASGARQELAHAHELQVQKPTYYGAAWDALGRFLLADDVLGGCPPVHDKEVR